MAAGAGAAPAPIDQPARGIAFAVVAMALFTAQDAAIKWLSADYSIVQVLFVRSLFVLVACLALVPRSGGVRALRPVRPGLLLLRCALGIGAWFSYYVALTRMPIADTVALTFAAPLFVTALSMPLLGEPVGARRWTATAIGFLGVLIMVRPGSGLLQGAAGLALMGALFYGLSMIMTRALSRTETNATLMVFSAVTMLAVSSVAQPWVWIPPAPVDLALMAIAGLVAGGAQFSLIQAYRSAPASVVAPFDYTALLWAVLLGYLIWGDLPGAAVAVGAAIVIGSGLYTLHREHRLARAPGVTVP